MMFRIERDPLGEKEVPADALYGIQTLRAAENFPISGQRPLPAFVDAVVMIKRCAAETHRETGRLEAQYADALSGVRHAIPSAMRVVTSCDTRRPSASDRA